jgi:hypothetical protein
MPTQINDFTIELDDYSGYDENGNRKIEVDLNSIAFTLGSFARLEIVQIESQGAITAIISDNQNGVLIVDIQTKSDPVPSNKMAIINYRIINNSIIPGGEYYGRVIIQNIGYDLSLPLITLSYNQLPDTIELPIGIDDLISIYDIDTKEDAGYVTSFNRCQSGISDNDECCNDKEKCQTNVLQFSIDANFSVPDTVNPSETIYEGVIGGKAKLYIDSKNFENFNEASFDIKMLSQLSRITIDALVSEKESVLISNYRLHLDIENIFIEDKENMPECNELNACYNRLSLQVFNTEENEVINTFAISDNRSTRIKYMQSETYSELSICADFTLSNYNSVDKVEASGYSQTKLDVTFVFELDEEAKIIGYSLKEQVIIQKDDHIAFDKKCSIFDLSGPGGVDRTTGVDSETIDVTGNIPGVTTYNGGQLISNTELTPEFSIQIGDTSSVGHSLSGTLTFDSFDENMVQQSRIVLTPAIGLNWTELVDNSRQFNMGININFERFDGSLVSEATSTIELVTEITSTVTGVSSQQIDGVFPSVIYGGSTYADVSFSGTEHSKLVCSIPCNTEMQKPTFIVNKQSGFWLKPEAAHQIVYIQRSGNAHKFGLILIKHEPILGSNIEIEIPNLGI